MRYSTSLECAVARSLLSIIITIVGGCASLNDRSDVQRSAELVERATAASAEWLLLDAESAERETAALLVDGLTADEAVQVALLNNPLVRAATLEIGISRAEFIQSALFSNPSLALSLRFPDGGGLANFEASLAQNVAELWLVPARKKVALRALDRTVLESARTVAAIAFDTRRAYVRSVAFILAEHIARETLELHDRLLESAELRRRAGAVSELDVNLARTRRMEAVTTLYAAALARVEALSSLARLLGLPGSPESLALADSLPEPSVYFAPSDTLLAVAEAYRLDLHIAEQIVEEAHAAAEQERVRFLKTIDIGLAFERAERRSRSGPNRGADVLYDSLQSGQLTPPNLQPRERRRSEYLTGPTFRIELPLWDQNQAGIVRADRQWEQAVQFRDALLIDLAQDIHVRLARASSAAENALFLKEKLLPATERDIRLSLEAYRAGSLSMLSVLEAERSLLSARRGYVNALERAAVAAIELEQATGLPMSAWPDAGESEFEINPSPTGTSVPSEGSLP